jgi:glycosyltransferase involved in cell wall biosynthesis
MKIAILGTKGIPNNYGGFEQFAEYLSIGLVKAGHAVTVYNPNFHPYKETLYNGVRIQRIFSPERQIGGAANFIYDHLGLVHALKQDFDIIYEAGYHSVALSYYFLNVRKIKYPVIITNMDGLEWKRTKWSGLTRRIIRKLEVLAVNRSPYLVSDNLGIQDYYRDQFKRESFFIPYGADIVWEFNEDGLGKFGINKYQYFVLVARLEPENNVEMIISGHVRSNSTQPLIVVGNLNTKYSKYLVNKFDDPRIKFVGGVYDRSLLDSLRHFSLAYFHGHSVGGTNPSLLEAMGCSCFIMAHRNPFNQSVLGESALYFETTGDIQDLVTAAEGNWARYSKDFIQENLAKIRTLYNWDTITKKHEDLFIQLTQG